MRWFLCLVIAILANTANVGCASNYVDIDVLIIATNRGAVTDEVSFNINREIDIRVRGGRTERYEGKVTVLKSRRDYYNYTTAPSSNQRVAVQVDLRSTASSGILHSVICDVSGGLTTFIEYNPLATRQLTCRADR
jgi:hypothetical protein